MSTKIPLVAGVLPTTCYASHQAAYEDEFRHGYAYLAEGTLKYIIGNTAPGADDQDKLWIQTNADGTPVRQWIHQDGAWKWPHPVPVNDKRIYMFYGSTAEIDTLDGGVAGVVSSTSGPFWEVMSEMEGKFPRGVANLEDGTSVNVTNTGGSERVTLTSTQVPDHDHKGHAYYRASGGPAGSVDPSGLADTLYHENAGHTTSSAGPYAAAGVQTDEMGGTHGESHANLPPYYSVYFIRRTGRQYYVAS